MEKVVAKFLTSIGAPVAESQCEFLIRTHADYPSIVSISDTFDRLGLNHSTGLVSREELNNAPYPYMVHVNVNGGKILAVKDAADVQANEVELNYWSGVVIQVEPTPLLHVQERVDLYKQARFKRILVLFLVIATLGVLGLAIFESISSSQSIAYSVGIIIIALAALGGTALGYILLAKDLGIKYDSVEDFCKVEGQPGSDCNSVLNSAGATFFGLVKLSQFVFSFFLAQIIVLSAYGLNLFYKPHLESVFIVFASFSIFATAYSLFYQAFIVKAWCKLCMVVNGLLLVQFMVAIGLNNSKETSFAHPAIGYLTACSLLFCVIFAGAWLLTQVLKSNESMQKTESESLRVKNSIDVFQSLLRYSRRVDTTPVGDEILIGSPQSPLKLILAINLHCLPCKEHFDKVADAIKIRPDTLQISLRFVMSGRDAKLPISSVQYLIRYWRENIMGRAEQSQLTIDLLHDWFSTMNLNRFKSLRQVDFSMPDEVSYRDSVAHHQWTQRAGVARTPALFINSYTLPRNYNIDDIFAMTPELVQLAQKSMALV